MSGRSTGWAFVLRAALVVLAAIAACGPRERDPSPQARQRIADAKVLERDGRSSEALAAYADARSIDPGSALASLEAAELLGLMGIYAEAVAVFEEAIARAPRSPRPALRLAVLYRAAGRRELAHKAVEAAQAASGRDPDVLLEVGRMHLERDDPWKAATVLGAALSSRPQDAEVAYLLGRLERQRRAMGEGEAVLTRALEKDPASWKIRLELARLLGEAGQVRRAVALLDQALATRPLPSEVAAEAARLRARVDGAERSRPYRELADAIAACEQAIDHGREELWRTPGDAGARHALGEALLACGRASEAEGIFRGAVHLQPASPEAWAGVFAACLQAGREPCVEQALAKVAALDRERLVGLIDRARVLGSSEVPALDPKRFLAGR